MDLDGQNNLDDFKHSEGVFKVKYCWPLPPATTYGGWETALKPPESLAKPTTHDSNHPLAASDGLSFFSNKTLDTSQKLDSPQILHPDLKISKLALNIETLEEGKLSQNGKTH